jgi:hypothetical protein
MTLFWNLTVIRHAQNRKIGKSKDLKVFRSNTNKYPLQSVVIHNVLVCNAGGDGSQAQTHRAAQCVLEYGNTLDDGGCHVIYGNMTVDQSG